MCEELSGVWYYSSVKCEERSLGATAERAGQWQHTIRETMRNFRGNRRGQGQSHNKGRRQRELEKQDQS